MIAWCRGGMGAAHGTSLSLGRALGADTVALVDAAARDLTEGTDGAALCLCHGALGVLEFLARRRARPAWPARNRPRRGCVRTCWGG